MPRKVDDDCLRELRWLYDRREVAEVRRDLAQWLARWQGKYAKLCELGYAVSCSSAGAPAPKIEFKETLL
jgi:hypothetical protein